MKDKINIERYILLKNCNYGVLKKNGHHVVNNYFILKHL